MARHLHFDCFSGVSGDMVLGALVGAGLPFAALVQGLRGVPAKGYRLRSSTVRRGAIKATKVDVVIREGFRKPYSMAGIRKLIASSRLPSAVRAQALEAFGHLGGAESIAHGVKLDDVRFHEVGVVDSIVDVVGGVLGCHLLDLERITASPVNVGSGTIDTEHGRLPVPGPAVAALARGVPIYSAGPPRELTTPTGLALMKTLAIAFHPLPPMQVMNVGYGAGTGDPEGWPNVLRVFVGESDAPSDAESDTVMQLETNIDDLSGQVYETVMDRLFEAGSLDVTLTPVIMKHGRPGIVITALAAPEQADAVSAVLFTETSTLGVRMQSVARRTVRRAFTEVRVAGGTVHMKMAEINGTRRAAPEYQDCRRIAQQTGRPVRDVMEEALVAWRTLREGQGKRPKGKGFRSDKRKRARHG